MRKISGGMSFWLLKASIGIILILVATPASADEINDLKVQMKSMQEQMSMMQQKIEKLESEKASEATAPNLVVRKDHAGCAYCSFIEGRTTATNQANFGDVKLGTNSTLGFHGYTRLGAGFSDGGTTQAFFRAPEAQSKYRLGNEAELGLELAFDYRYYFENTKENSPYGQFWIRTDTYDAFGDSDGLSLDGIPEAYINFANINDQGMSIWAGRRFYERMDIHINDHYWLNAGQGANSGFGFEGLKIGTGELKAAVFRLEDEFSDSTVDTTRLDIRLKDIDLNKDGKISFWSDFSIREENDVVGIDKKYGYGLGAWHTQKNILGGSNRLALTYRTGASMVQGLFNARPVRESAGYDLNDARVIELNNDFLFEPSENFAMQHAFIFRREDRGVRGVKNDNITWLSTGVRPVWFITDHVSIPIELGYDYVIDKVNDRAGDVKKLTLAVQYAPSKGYFVRPVFRVFATLAHWSDDFKGLVGVDPGDAPYSDDTLGYTLGTQVEWWW